MSEYFVVYAKNGKMKRTGFDNVTEASADFRHKKNMDEFFEDRFAVGIEDAQGNQIAADGWESGLDRPSVLAVIPARGGSKRIPYKNVVNFCGRPMISWPIQALEESGVVDEIIVSTDSEEIRDIAKRAGAHAPFVRPPHLSGDHVGTAEVTQHAVEWFIRNRGVPDYV